MWVQINGLPILCWEDDSLSILGSIPGSPKYANECTSKVKRLGYARMLIEVDVINEVKHEVCYEGIGELRHMCEELQKPKVKKM